MSPIFPHASGGHHLSGMICAIIGYTLLTLADTLLKQVSRLDAYPQWQLMAMIGAVCATTVLSIALLRGGPRRLATRRPGLHLLRSGLSLTSFFCGLYAIRHIQLVDFYGIIFAMPILIAALSVLWLKEAVSRSRWLAIGCGFIGVTIMLKAGATQAQTVGQQFGYGAALCCAIFNAVATIIVRRHGHDESNMAFSFYSALCNMTVNGLLCLYLGTIAMPPGHLVMLLVTGILLGIASVLMMTAFQRSPPAAIVPFQYTQLVWGALLGYLIFRDVPTPLSLLGAAIVIGSGWIMLWREAKLARALKRAAQTHAHISEA